MEVSEGKWGFVDKTGKVFASLTGPGAEQELFSDGLAPSEKSGSNGIGFANTSGELVIAPRFAFVQPFSEDLAAVKEDKLWGYIGKSGVYVIKPRFCDPEDWRAGLFHEGLAFACDPATKKYGFIDGKGRFVIAPRFNHCADPFGRHCAFDGGLAWVENDRRQGYINAKGAWIWSTRVGQGRNAP